MQLIEIHCTVGAFAGLELRLDCCSQGYFLNVIFDFQLKLLVDLILSLIDTARLKKRRRAGSILDVNF